MDEVYSHLPKHAGGAGIPPAHGADAVGPCHTPPLSLDMAYAAASTFGPASRPALTSASWLASLSALPSSKV